MLVTSQAFSPFPKYSQKPFFLRVFEIRESVVKTTTTVSQTSPCFYVYAEQVFWKQCGEKKKLLVTSNFSISNSFLLLWGTFCHLHQFQNCCLQTYIYRICHELTVEIKFYQTSLVKSNFFFSHSVFYHLGELFAIFISFKIVACKLFRFGRVWNLSFGNRIKPRAYSCFYSRFRSRWDCKEYNSVHLQVLCVMSLFKLGKVRVSFRCKGSRSG